MASATCDDNTFELKSSSTNISSVPEFKRSNSLLTSSDGDRFLPHRGGMNSELAHFNLAMLEKESGKAASATDEGYEASLKNSLYDGDLDNAKVLAFKSRAPICKNKSAISRSSLYTENRSFNKCKRTRHVPLVPMKILDAPDMLDNFYLNLLDWNSQNILAVGLGSAVYLWHASSGQASKLMEVSSTEHITAIKWTQSTSHVAVSTSEGKVELWDTAKEKKLRTFSENHQAGEATALSWNKHILTSSGKDGKIVNSDVRMKEHHLSVWRHPNQDMDASSGSKAVCGLQWSPDGAQLASGGNDDLVCIWDVNNIGASSNRPLFKMAEHVSAVKALDWCPWQKNLLVSGGGTADRTLRFWDTKTGKCVNHIETDSQVCSVKWSRHHRELVSSHGYSNYQLTVWNYPSLTRMVDLTGHKSRVLHMATSPDGEVIASAAGDETVQFWNVFARSSSSSKGKKGEKAADSENKASKNRFVR